jgi:hypothetical protein
MAEQEKKAATKAAPGAPAGQPAQQQVQLDETGVKTCYSNFCYTAGTREGVLFGFGLHDWQPGRPVKVDAKVEMSYFNSKRLLATLNQIVERHEKAFGEVEVDMNKRMKA